MFATKISRNPAQTVAELIVTQKTSNNLATTAARLHFEYMKENPDHTQDMFQVWAAEIQENGLCRLYNEMNSRQKSVARAELPRIVEEIGKVRGNSADLTVWLPEKYPGKNPIKGMRDEYVEPDEEATKPYDLQVKTKNVLQSHPEVYEDNAGDSFHIVEPGTGVAPSGKLYSDPKPLPKDIQLSNTAGEVQFYAKVGGTTTLSLAKVEYIKQNPTGQPLSKKQLKGAKERAITFSSVGNHVRVMTSLQKTITRITGKYDGAKSDLFSTNGKVYMTFRDGTKLWFRQSGAPLTDCHMTIEWVDPIPGDWHPVEGSGISHMEGKIPIVTTVDKLNFPNVFGFGMIAAIGSTTGTKRPKRRPYSRIVFDFDDLVPVRTPKVLWELGKTPLWSLDLDELYAAGPDETEDPTTMHRVDGMVFHGAGGEQDLVKFYKTVDLDAATAKELGVFWSSEGTLIREYFARMSIGPDGEGTPQYIFWRNRDEDNGGVKYRPNSIQNIEASAKSPDVDTAMAFLRRADYHDRLSRVMENLEDEVARGLTEQSWEDLVTAIENEEVADDDLGDLLREYYGEKGDFELPQDGEYRDLFAQYFKSG